MTDPNPYATPGPDSGSMLPGYYVTVISRLTWREIWRMSPKWAYPLAALLVKSGSLDKQAAGRFSWLPSTVLTERCAEDAVPEPVRETLAPLLVKATEAGFTVYTWGTERRSVQTDSSLVTGGVHLFDGRGTGCWLVSCRGVTSGKTIDKVLVSFGSLDRSSGVVLATMTEDRGFDHHPDTRVKVVRGAGFAALLAAHLQRIRGGDFVSDADRYFQRLDAMTRESWEERVKRGLFKRVASSREDLEALLGRNKGG